MATITEVRNGHVRLLLNGTKVVWVTLDVVRQDAHLMRVSIPHFPAVPADSPVWANAKGSPDVLVLRAEPTGGWSLSQPRVWTEYLANLADVLALWEEYTWRPAFGY